MTYARLLREWRVGTYREVMSRAPKPAVSWLSGAVSTEVKVLMTRRGLDAKTLAAASGIKVGRLGYLLRRERSWNIVEVEDVAAVFGLAASELVGMAEAAAETGNVVPLLPQPGAGVPHPGVASVTRWPEDDEELLGAALDMGREPGTTVEDH